MIPDTIGSMLVRFRFVFLALLVAVIAAVPAAAKTAPEIMGAELWKETLAAKERFASKVTNDKYMVVIDYRRVSGEPRFYLVDMPAQSARSFLVSHGQGSDPDHDGMADIFSNRQGSKMTSLGAFVTAETYYGRHGLSLRLDGLERHNNAARERAIVIHGADYVTPKRKKMGRSWGCPALEQTVAQDLIPKIANGVFLYVRGPDMNVSSHTEIIDQAR